MRAHPASMISRQRVWSLGERLFDEMRRDRLSNGAATLAFYSTLALFPAAIFALSILPYLPIPHLQEAIFELLRQLLPGDAANLFTQTVTTVVSQRSGALLSFGFLFTVWSASSGTQAIIDQLNIVYGVKESRPFWKARLVAVLLVFTFVALVILTFGLVIFGGVIQDWLAARLGWSPTLLWFFATFRWAVLVFALLCSFALIYRIAPNVDHRRFRLFRAGNVLAVAGFLASSFAFKVYVGNFGHYDATYGSLGAAIVLLLWLLIAGWMLLIGGELNELLDGQAGPMEATEPSSIRKQIASRVTSRHRGPLSAGIRRPVSIVVWGAVAANVALAMAKIVAAGATGSSALISEAIHSVADAGNGLLLVLGVKLSQKPADAVHPFGRGQEVYFWGLIVAVVLFGLGGGISLYEGVQHVIEPHPIANPLWSYVVLGCALLFEGASFALAVINMRKLAAAQSQPFFEAAHSSKNPEHFVVLFEDAAAIVGIVVAFVGVYASHALGMPALDGVASIIIGVILAVTALFLAYECRSLLLGEGADPHKVADIHALAARDPEVQRVGPPLTMYLGPDEVLLNLEVQVREGLTVEQTMACIQRVESTIRAHHGDVRRIFIEVARVMP